MEKELAIAVKKCISLTKKGEPVHWLPFQTRLAIGYKYRHLVDAAKEMMNEIDKTDDYSPQLITYYNVLETIADSGDMYNHRLAETKDWRAFGNEWRFSDSCPYVLVFHGMMPKSSLGPKQTQIYDKAMKVRDTWLAELKKAREMAKEF